MLQFTKVISQLHGIFSCLSFYNSDNEDKTWNFSGFMHFVEYYASNHA